MESPQREFLDELLSTPSPSGFETRGQRVWVDYVSEFADTVSTDEYGNAVAVYEGGGDPSIAFAGHADEIGFIVRRISEDGFLKLGRIGGSDHTVSKGQHVTVHAADGPVHGVVGQTAIHLRERGSDEYDDIGEQHVDIGAEDGEAARELIEVGDPITFATTVYDLQGSRIAARGMDNRVGTWAAAEGLRLAAEADADATVYAVSTVQEEVGLNGARMVGFDLEPDVFVAVDVTHATDSPDAPGDKGSDIDLGAGPVIGRGSANHPVVVERMRETAEAAGIDVQLMAAGIRTGTDADGVFTQRSGIPSLNVGVPNRYMHTPVEVIDTEDLVAVGELLGAFASEEADADGFSVSI